MSTALKLLEDALTDVIKRKDTAIQQRAKHEREVDNYDTVARLLAEEEVELRKAVEAVSVIDPEPKWLKKDERCSKPLMDGRHEIRCWKTIDHEGECA